MAKIARIEGELEVVPCHVPDNSNDDIDKRKKAFGKMSPNHVLLLTIFNPFYPIDVTVVYSICKPFGKVLRIVIFRKNGVQSMVEMENIEAAEKVKNGLNEREIYSGCCKLKIEYAKPIKLNVVRNNSETWDYTLEPAKEVDDVELDLTGDSVLPLPNDKLKDDYIDEIGNSSMSCSFNSEFYESSGYTKGYNYSDCSSVVMAYNLDEKQMNPNGVFNLFCMYGNVIKIKFLKSKKGCAMIQMGDRQGAERCLLYLQGLPLFGDVLQLGLSKQPFLNDLGRGFELPDGSHSWKEFSNSKNNRFLTPAMARRNRLNAPSNVLHFFNMPPDLTEDRLEGFVLTTAQVGLKDITVFPNKGDKSASGLMEFESIDDAVCCVIYCNNVPLHAADGGPPFFIKLCFSSVKSIAVAEQEYEKRNAQNSSNYWL